MRRAVSVGVLLAAVLSGCQRATPDFTETIASPDGDYVAVVRGYQPRGTIDGRLTLAFAKDANESEPAVILRMDQGRAGWLNNDVFAVVASRMEYRSVASDYYADGTVDTRIRLMICVRETMDCSAADRQLDNAAGVKVFARFPEDGGGAP